MAEDITPEVGGRYLFRSQYGEGDLSDISIMEMTEKSVSIRYNATKLKRWLTKEAFNKMVIHEQLKPEVSIRELMKQFEYNPDKTFL